MHTGYSGEVRSGVSQSGVFHSGVSGVGLGNVFAYTSGMPYTGVPVLGGSGMLGGTLGQNAWSVPGIVPGGEGVMRMSVPGSTGGVTRVIGSTSVSCSNIGGGPRIINVSCSSTRVTVPCDLRSVTEAGGVYTGVGNTGVLGATGVGNTGVLGATSVGNTGVLGATVTGMGNTSRVGASVTVTGSTGLGMAVTSAGSTSGEGVAMSEVSAGLEASTGGTSSAGVVTAMSTALLAHQLPPLSKFEGGVSAGGDKETVKEWLEQFELVAGVCKWDDSTRLVNLVTRLRGEAYAFYKSCSPQQRASYAEMAAALTKRFTPVRIQAVQCSLFHERRQKDGESVDSYAQALRVLFHKAYPSAQRGSPEAESMGKAVLASQFASGLLPELRAKVAGVEGDFDTLLAKARFEEAKFRDLAVRQDRPKKQLPLKFIPRQSEKKFVS